jgi:hypothetical protein
MPGVNNEKVRDSIKKFLEKMKACDNIPEELADDAVEMVEGVNEALDEEADIMEITKDEAPELEGKIESIIRKVLMESGLIKDNTVSALDELEEKLEALEKDECPEEEEEEIIISDEDNEEEVTVDPESIRDSKNMLGFIREIKPVVASIKDAKERKRFSDKMARIIGNSMKDNASYNVVRNVAKKNATNAMKKKNTVVDNDIDYGMEIAKKYNPHYKEV